MNKHMRLGKFLALAVLVFTLTASLSMAQQGGGQGGQGGGRRGGGRQGGGQGGFGGTQFVVDNIHQNLTATDDEWKVIEPLLTTVVEKNNAVNAGRGGRQGGGRRGQGGQGGQGAAPAGPANPVADAMTALRTALENQDTPAADIQAKLKAVRDARTKAEAEQKTAREALRKVLNARQEAQIVVAGQLD